MFIKTAVERKNTSYNVYPLGIVGRAAISATMALATVKELMRKHSGKQSIRYNHPLLILSLIISPYPNIPETQHSARVGAHPFIISSSSSSPCPIWVGALILFIH